MALSKKERDEILNALENISEIRRCENPKVSVIIPVYNSEKYIAKCLMSLVTQTEKEIEIIIINDGTKDDSAKIVSLFAEKDKRVVYIEQEHKLQGAARNAGINAAKGEYIGFVDSDDWIDQDYFEKLYAAAAKYNSDLALCTNIRIGNGKTKKRINIEKEEYITDLQAKFDICHQWKDGCPTNKIYRTDFIKKHNIYYPEGVYCEDKIFTTKSLYYSKGIVTVPNIYYYYFRNPNSTVKRKNNKKKYEFDKNNARLEVLKFLKENNAPIRDRDFWAKTKEIKFLGIAIYTRKESLHTSKHYLLSIIKVKEDIL